MSTYLHSEARERGKRLKQSTSRGKPLDHERVLELNRMHWEHGMSFSAIIEAGGVGLGTLERVIVNTWFEYVQLRGAK